ncbi:MAG: peptidylprolyl isomerase, partial [Bdellovibrionales bacterium]|nr:peptidylprolyl isomerase [Bdellovibrionales bacterium]
TFHRIVKKFIAQTGDPFGNNKGSGPGYTLPLEISERLVHDRYGVVSMARHKGESHGSQFFITFGPIPHLNRVNTVFGQVVDGVNILEQIENVKTDREDKPRYPVKIRNIKIERIY